MTTLPNVISLKLTEQKGGATTTLQFSKQIKMKHFYGFSLPIQFDCGSTSKTINENRGNREKNPPEVLHMKAYALCVASLL